jgi:A118 family predicted phage portal protein
MFTKIMQWIREVLSKMINQSSVKDALKVDVAISPVMADALQRWALMYANQSPWLNDEIKSLNLPASIASEIARAVTIEMEVEISGGPRADYLSEQMEAVTNKIRQYAEFGIAKGGLMFKPYVNDGRVYVDYVQADCFYPIRFDANGMITTCVFSDTRIIGKSYYTRLEYHTMTADGCEIKNMAYKADSQNELGRQVELSAVEDWAELEPEATITGVDKPLYAYFRFPVANNVDTTSPLGVSCFARAEGLIEQADRIYSNLAWEFESGKRAIYADTAAFELGTDKKPRLPDKRLYRTLNSVQDVGEGGKLFQEWSPAFREASIISGLDAILKKIEFLSGLAYGTISDPNVVANTATEIKMQKQRSYATITDTQKALEDALEQLLYAMDVWATLANLAPRGDYEAVYSFDDSIVADHDTQFLQDSQALGLGVMGKVEFRMRTYGETEAVAKKKIAEIQAESAAAMDMFGLPSGGQSNSQPGDNQNMPADGNGQMMQDQQAA